MEEKRNEERTPAIVRNNDRRFKVRLYNDCCAGLLNEQFRGTEFATCV
jgi:hypothetical protein